MAFKMKGSPMQRNFGLNTPMQGKGYVSDAQRKAVHASKADGGKGNPNKMLKGDQHKIDKNKDGKISKEDFDMMNKSPLEQKTQKTQKTTKLGKKINCPGDMMYHEPTGSCMSVEAYEDAMGVGKGSNRKVMKSDPKTVKKLEEIEKKKSKMSKEELAEMQRKADDKADRFHKRGKYAVKNKK